jgi:hypothetical protein
MQAARPSLSTRIVIAILVAAALLFAQWAGLNHKISHAKLQQYITHAAAIADIADDENPGHSCAEFDAATVGDTIHIVPFVTPLVTSAKVLALWAAFISWDAPVTTYFSSRAPPRA